MGSTIPFVAGLWRGCGLQRPRSLGLATASTCSACPGLAFCRNRGVAGRNPGLFSAGATGEGGGGGRELWEALHPLPPPTLAASSLSRCFGPLVCLPLLCGRRQRVTALPSSRAGAARSPGRSRAGAARCLVSLPLRGRPEGAARRPGNGRPGLARGRLRPPPGAFLTVAEPGRGRRAATGPASPRLAQQEATGDGPGRARSAGPLSLLRREGRGGWAAAGRPLFKRMQAAGERGNCRRGAGLLEWPRRAVRERLRAILVLRRDAGVARLGRSPKSSRPCPPTNPRRINFRLPATTCVDPSAVDFVGGTAEKRSL